MPVQLDNEHHAAADVEKAARKVLKDLQQEYIDLFLIHWPVVKNCKGDTLKPSIKVRPFTPTAHSHPLLLESQVIIVWSQTRFLCSVCRSRSQ